MLNRLVLAVGLSLLVPATAVAEDKIGRFELLHLWATKAEQAALARLREPLEARGVEWQEQFVKTNFSGVRATYAERHALGIPPTAVGWIGDDELGGLIDEGSMRLIPDSVGDQRFSDILQPEVYEIVRHRHGITSIPIGVHVQNNAIYNRALFKQVGRDLPSSWEDFLATAAIFKENGIVAFSMSDKQWQMRTLMLAIMSQYVSDDEFEKVFGKKLDLDLLEKRLTQSLSTLGQLRAYANPGNHELYWQDAVELVRDGKAAANFLGDFNAPMVADNPDVVCAHPPGNRIIIWAFDTIAFSTTEEPKEIEGQRVFAEVAATPEHHANYLAKKGGLPAFRDTPMDNMLECTRSKMALWNSSMPRFHLAGGAWAVDLNLITSAAREFWGSDDQDPRPYVQAAIKSITALRAVDER